MILWSLTPKVCANYWFATDCSFRTSTASGVPESCWSPSVTRQYLRSSNRKSFTEFALVLRQSNVWSRSINGTPINKGWTPESTCSSRTSPTKNTWYLVSLLSRTAKMRSSKRTTYRKQKISNVNRLKIWCWTTQMVCSIMSIHSCSRTRREDAWTWQRLVQPKNSMLKCWRSNSRSPSTSSKLMQSINRSKRMLSNLMKSKSWSKKSRQKYTLKLLCSMSRKWLRCNSNMRTDSSLKLRDSRIKWARRTSRFLSFRKLQL